MKHDFLSRLRRSGIYYLIGALLLLLVIPLYQLLILNPSGYSSSLTPAAAGNYLASYLSWLSTHNTQFLIYRVIQILAIALLLSLPFMLFRIIVAQEIVGQQEREEEERAAAIEEDTTASVQPDEEPAESNGLPAFAWRGKGFAVIAAWSGLLGLSLYVLGTIASTVYLAIVSSGFTIQTPLPASFSVLFSIFSLLANTIGIGLIALSTLFFGATIARSGSKLWPGLWVAFGYIALGVAALLSGGAVASLSTPTAGQAVLSSLSILLFALWVLWFGVMLVRLRPEQ